MKLLEHQGKQLLKMAGIKTPAGMVLNNQDSVDAATLRKFFTKHKNVMVKAQIMGGGRKKAGLVLDAKSYPALQKQIKKLFAKKHQGTPVGAVLVEQKLAIAAEYFVSITYNTLTRRPIILFSTKGGIHIEKNTGTITSHHPAQVATLSAKEGFKIAGNKKLADVLVKAYKAFVAFDCLALEINPIIKTKQGFWYAADAKITIDDAALPRQQKLHAIAAESQSQQFSARELAARHIDENDHRGVAGKTFLELKGDIAVLASGGGASLAAMDALIEAGGKPANYTEYSGNPSREKVRALTEITLSGPNMHGCLVIGGVANFTDIFETLSGFAEGISHLPALPKYPIVIRRAGPRDTEAFDMLRRFAKKQGLDITLFGKETPMSYAAKIMAEKSAAYTVNYEMDN